MLAQWLAYGESAADTPYLATVPASSIQAALKKLGRRVDDINLFEVNEAFAAVACTAMDLLGEQSELVRIDNFVLHFAPTTNWSARVNTSNTAGPFPTSSPSTLKHIPGREFTVTFAARRKTIAWLER